LLGHAANSGEYRRTYCKISGSMYFWIRDEVVAAVAAATASASSVDTVVVLSMTKPPVSRLAAGACRRV
jgi:hypothetical protein